MRVCLARTTADVAVELDKGQAVLARLKPADRAAELLGLNRNTLRKKIRELEIPVVRRGAEPPA